MEDFTGNASTVNNAEPLIESLDLTRMEELQLRHIAGLGHPQPKTRLDRLLYTSLSGEQAVLAFLVAIGFLAALSFGAWKLSTTFRTLSEILGVFIVPILLLSFLLGERASKRLILKLYRALEKERASNRWEGA